MPRHFAIGNGKFLVNLDEHSFIRDIYFPYVGQLNHAGGFPCRVGVWTEDKFSWLSDAGWKFELSYAEDSLVTEIVATHEDMQLQLTINDAIHQRDDIYLKKVAVRDLSGLARPQDTAAKSPAAMREVRIFFHQDLMINESEVGDTAAYYPDNNTVFHYKKDSYFMFSGLSGQEGMYQYTIGVKRFHQAEGTWRDAEDGHLMGNAISQGSVDSTISFRVFVPQDGEQAMYYWMAVGKSLEDVKKFNAYVLDSHPAKLLNRIRIYWQRWVNKSERRYADLSEAVIAQFKISLLIVRTQTDIRGAIIAANDTDILQSNRDHYSYMWPRDGALIAYAMSMAGYQGMIAPFFQFCANVLTPDGYLQHKYNPDGTVGSSWHPYIAGGKRQLPIQEDETALVLYALWQDFDRHGLIELPQSLYRTLIRRAARFMMGYIVPELGLPQPSYDLWEERYGIYTFTCSAVYGGLMAAANFSSLFGDDERSGRYRAAAESIKAAMIAHLWNEELGRFARGLHLQDGKWVQDMTLESSMFGLFAFGVLPADDDRVVRTMTAIKEGLAIQTEVGGIARYHNDYYFQRSNDIDRIPGNPWIICTLWVAEWQIEAAKSRADLAAPRRTLEWAVRHAMESGVLPEQLDPFDGSPLSVAPLTWSHATLVLVVSKYVEKYDRLAK